MKINIWSNNLKITDRVKFVAERRLNFALHAFKNKIRDVDVFLTDLKGAQDGRSRLCRLTINFKSSGHIIVNDHEKRFAMAITKAAERVKMTMSRKMDKKRDIRSARQAKLAQQYNTSSSM
ncbi:MAG: HPF/RaiA family ribosome-associated protein [Deltaproteobacteria bacterium]|nr:HPF/RaiA family ribosome-associated protein [Deltaproteobacteria bacterium]